MTTKSVKTIDTTKLPDDPAELKALINDLKDLVGDLDAQREYLLQKLYGRHSEKLTDPGQLNLGFIDASANSLSPSGPETSAFPSSAEVVGASRKGHGRRPIPKSIPRERIRYTLPEAERTCPTCHTPAVKIGEEISEQLEYKPAVFIALEHVQEKYACRCCGKFVVLAPGPEKPIEKGLPGPGLLSHVVTSKYADHLPLYRLEGIYQRSGLEISRSTLSGWVGNAADLLEPIPDAMAEDVLKGKKIHTDDTKLPVIEDEKAGKTREGRIWTYIGDDEHPHILFRYCEDRSRDGPVEYLSNFAGFLHADADQRLDGLFLGGKIIEVACWAHARRNFYEARSTDPIRAFTVLGLIKKLYAVEEEGRVVDAVTRQALREKLSKPVLAEIRAFLVEEQVKVLPKSPMGKAIQYARNQWAALNRYVEDGDLDIDNNVAERALRHVVKGRDNWTFAGSDAGGRRAAILFSVVMTCKRHGVDPFAYIRDVIGRVSKHPARLVRDLLPDRWKALQQVAPTE